MSNNPPFCTLELTKEEAELLMKSASSNMRVALVGIQMSARSMKPETVRELVSNTDIFKSIRQKLLNQGVRDED